MAVSLGALGGNILPKGAAKGHIHHLEPPADGKDRLSCPGSPADQLQLKSILHPVHTNHRVPGLLPKILGGDVHPAGDQQGVKGLHQTGAILRQVGDGEQHRDPPGPDNGFYIGIVGFVDRPLPPAGGHSDDGLHSVSSFRFCFSFHYMLSRANVNAEKDRKHPTGKFMESTLDISGPIVYPYVWKANFP